MKHLLTQRLDYKLRQDRRFDAHRAGAKESRKVLVLALLLVVLAAATLI